MYIFVNNMHANVFMESFLDFIPLWFLSVSADSAKPTRSSSEQSEVKDKAPVIPFGLDLYYWGEEQPAAGKIIKYRSNYSLIVTYNRAFWIFFLVHSSIAG